MRPIWRVKILLLTIIFLTACESAKPVATLYCPAWPSPTAEERADLKKRIPPDSLSFGWFQRLYILKTELDTCRRQQNAGD